jgi:AcrR family transcriptional regulator
VKQRRESQGTAERILTLAMEQLDARGEAGLRVSEICTAVGVPVTSLYHYYGSREGLVEAAYAELYIRNLHEELEVFKERTALCKDVRDFRLMLHGTLAAFQEPDAVEFRLRRVHILGAAYRRPGLRDALLRAQELFFASLASVILSTQQMGWVRAELDGAAFGAWFQGQVMGEAVVLLGESMVTPERWGAISQQAVFALLFGDVPGTPIP